MIKEILKCQNESLEIHQVTRKVPGQNLRVWQFQSSIFQEITKMVPQRIILRKVKCGPSIIRESQEIPLEHKFGKLQQRPLRFQNYENGPCLIFTTPQQDPIQTNNNKFNPIQKS